MLTNENYFAPEMEKKFMGTTQLKRFIKCEHKAMAMLNGEWSDDNKQAFVVGNYIDAHFEGSLDLFKAKNPNIFCKTGKNAGELKSEFRQAETSILRAERDEMFMKFMSGEKQVIKTGEVFGVPFKIKIDSYLIPKEMGDMHAIVDLKAMKDLLPIWQDGMYVPFVEAYQYDLQGAIYQAVEGNKLPFYLAVVTKEKTPDLAILQIPQERMDFCLDNVKDDILRAYAVKMGTEKPIRCEQCDYCKHTKKITSVVNYDCVG